MGKKTNLQFIYLFIRAPKVNDWMNKKLITQNKKYMSKSGTSPEQILSANRTSKKLQEVGSAAARRGDKKA